MIMRRCFLVILFALFLAPSGFTQDDMGLLVFFRPSRVYGLALSPSVYVDGRQIARLDNGRYCSLYVSPGSHITTSSMKKESALDLDVKASEAIYLEMVILQGTWKGEGRLIPAPLADATRELGKLKPLEKNRIVDTSVVFDTQPKTPSVK